MKRMDATSSSHRMPSSHAAAPPVWADKDAWTVNFMHATVMRSFVTMAGVRLPMLNSKAARGSMHPRNF
jgi:hypothetical protein